MTLAEKIAQLGSIWAFEVVGPDGLDRDRMAALLGEGLGEITRLAGSTNLRPTEVAVAANAIQRYLAEETRLGIPVIVHEECLHGVLGWGAPCFQQAIGAAATFDPDSLAAVVATIRRRLLLTGARHALAPVLDIARDAAVGPDRGDVRRGPLPRRGDGRGLRPGDPGRATRGRRSSPPASTSSATASPRAASTRRRPMPAGASCATSSSCRSRRPIREAALGSVMPAYCDVDGVPCHASRELLEDDRPRRVGVRRARRLGLRRDRDAQPPAQADRRPGDRGRARPRGRGGPRAAAIGGLRRAARPGDPDRSRRGGDPRRLGRPRPRGEVPARPVRGPVRRAAERRPELADLAATEQAAGRELARRSIVLVENDGVLPLWRPTCAGSR